MSRRDVRRAAKPDTPHPPARPQTARPPARSAQPPRPRSDTRSAAPRPGAWQMNPDLWYRPDPTLTWPIPAELRQNSPGMPASRHEVMRSGPTPDPGQPISPIPASFTFVFTAPQPDGAPPGAAQELGHALIRVLDEHLQHDKTRCEIDFEGEPFL